MLVPMPYALVSADNVCQILPFEQIGHRFGAEVHAAGALRVEGKVSIPCFSVFGRVRPEQVQEHVLLVGLALAIDPVDAEKGGDLLPDTPVHAELLAVNDAS